MKIVSINLNKRLNDPDRRFVDWLALQAPSVLIVQESVTDGQPLPPTLCDLSLVGGDYRVACWAKPGIARTLETCAVPALLIETETLVICTTYLSPYSSKLRVAQVEGLHQFLLNRAKPIILAGDFNTALTLADGLYGDDFSRWTSAGERSALQRLSVGLGVTDLTSRLRLGEQHFTFERPIKGNGRASDAILLSPLLRRASARITTTTSGRGRTLSRSTRRASLTFILVKSPAEFRHPVCSRRNRRQLCHPIP